MFSNTMKLLGDRFRSAVGSSFGDDCPFDEQWIKPCNDPRFGDYQFNGALPLAKSLQKKPRDIAETLAGCVELADISAPLEIAGPGFLNIRLTNAYLSNALTSIPAGETSEYDRLGLQFDEAAETVVVDMSSPNLAKEMHVGHLRSTVIGESVSRILEFAGHTVERVNHVGDWGTQFGMLITHLRDVQPDVISDPDSLAIGDLEAFYVAAKKAFDSSEDFANRARQAVVQLQGGDEETLAVWRAFCDESLRHCHAIYDRLGITKLEDRGESFYNDQLAPTVQELTDAGMVETSDGAECIFLDDFKNRDGEPLPMIVRKSDGGFNYSATDLAAVRHRLRDVGATRLIYVVGIPQQQHFAMLFAAIRKSGWAADSVRLEHLAFGSMLGRDGKPFKTRDGGTVKLKNLLEEAVQAARAAIDERQGDDDDRALSESQKQAISEAVGIGAVKYADLSHSLTTDYRFDMEQMLSFEGNTAPYMLYAYARIRSIGRKADIDLDALPADAPITIEHDAEIALAKMITRFPEVISQIVRDLRPNVLTEYLYELTKAFSRFYDRRHGVRVTDAEPESTRMSRLRLCQITARTIKSGLYLLGIDTIEQM
ncbi:MAG TPA: arginine--tRNA ligase [Phycisphaerae bacterium]|nr:arginine--tRNA ligase [Phycisphaerae bacterium]